MKTRLSTAVLLAALLAGCALPPLAGPTPGVTGGQGATAKPSDKAPLVDPKTGKIVPNQPVEPLNGVEFKPLTQGNTKYLNNGGGGAESASRNAAAPAAAPAPTMAADSAAGGGASFGAVSDHGMAKAGVSAGGAPGAPAGPGGGQFSGNVWSSYGYGYYFGYGGSGFEQMALVSMQEAETKGSKGSFQEIVSTIAAPIVKAWAADARLIETGSVLGNDGSIYVEAAGPNMDPAMAKDMMIARPMPAPGMPGMGDGNGWRLAYVSTERREMLRFVVTGEKTTIIRMRWAELDLAPERVTVDSATAVKSLIAAITEKAYRSEEEKTGKDYFLGFSFEQPKTGEWDGDYQKTEVLYEVPKNARWNVTLSQTMGKLVWDLNWYAEQNPTTGSAGVAVGMATPAIAMDMPVSSEPGMTKPAYPVDCAPPEMGPETYFNYNGQGLVDAETGAVIRFTRPTKMTYNYPKPDYYPCPEPRPLPVEPKPVPQPEPAKETPKPVATPTAASSGSAGSTDQ